VRNWAGNIEFGAARVHRPGAVEELQGVVAAADRVRVVGSGHSFNRIADTDGDLVRVDGLPGSLVVDPESSTVDIAAGMRYAEVAAALHAQGYALTNMASLPHISVAGSCATGTHGSGSANQSLAAAVTAQRIVGPDGEMAEWRRGDAGFAGTVVGLGALGVVVGMTLAVEPTYQVAQWVYDGVPLERVVGDFEELFAAAYSVSAFTDWRGGEAVVWRKERTDRSTRPAERWLGGRLADGPRHPIAGMPTENATQQLGVVGPWHERLPHFRPEFTPSNGTELQSELLLPREAAGEAIAALRSLGERMAPVVQVSEIRTVAADELWLSPAYGRDTVAFHFTWTQDTDLVLAVVADMEKLLNPLGARPHWGKLTATPPDEILAGYERAADFAALRRVTDPAGKFRNAYVASFFPAG
jgi:alditol oxidase